MEGELADLTFSIALTDDHLSVYSVRLSELLLRACAECENAAKSLCIDRDLNAAGRVTQALNFPSVLDVICPSIPIEKKELLITWPYQSLSSTELKPFGSWVLASGVNPDWFKAYNEVKHNRINNAKQANLGNVIHAVGGLFVLNLWLREEEISFANEHRNLVDRRMESYSKFFSPRKFFKRSEGGNYGNLVLS